MCNVQFCAHQHISLFDLFGRNTVEENFGVFRGPAEENKKTASASCKLYVLAPALKNSERCGQSENAAEQENIFAKKCWKKIWSRVTTVWLLVGFFRLSELTGPVGPAKENWPNCPAFRDFDRYSGFLFFPSFGSHINPKYGPKRARSALRL
jgi:hypothetical protein